MENIHLKENNLKLQMSFSGCDGDHQGCQEKLEDCVATMEEGVEEKTQQLEEDLSNCNLNFEARVQEVTT